MACDSDESYIWVSCNVLKHISAFIKSSQRTVRGSSFSKTRTTNGKIIHNRVYQIFFVSPIHWTFNAGNVFCLSHELHRLHQDHSSKGTKRQCNYFLVYSRHYFILIRLISGEIVLLESILHLTSQFDFVAIFALEKLFNQSLSFTSRLLTAVFVSIISLL